MQEPKNRNTADPLDRGDSGQRQADHRKSPGVHPGGHRYRSPDRRSVYFYIQSAHDDRRLWPVFRTASRPHQPFRRDRNRRSRRSACGGCAESGLPGADRPLQLLRGTERTSSAGTTHLGDENAEEVNASWAEGREGARAITAQEGDFVGIYGFEMTWSGGAPGHINTFNSEGFENRNAAPYKKGDNYEVLEAYYDTLKANPGNHLPVQPPGRHLWRFHGFRPL